MGTEMHSRRGIHSNCKLPMLAGIVCGTEVRPWRRKFPEGHTPNPSSRYLGEGQGYKTPIPGGGIKSLQIQAPDAWGNLQGQNAPCRSFGKGNLRAGLRANSNVENS